MNARTRALVVGGVLAVLAAGIGIGTALAGNSNPSPSTPAVATVPSSTPADFTLAGTMALKLGAFQWDHAADGSTPCAGYQGYADITAGTPVVITDQRGTVIATGQLGTGSATVDSTTGRATACTFSFAVPHVPDRPLYAVTVSHRGAVTYSAEQVKSGRVGLTLG